MLPNPLLNLRFCVESISSPGEPLVPIRTVLALGKYIPVSVSAGVENAGAAAVEPVARTMPEKVFVTAEN